jgi:hypothetical protein
MYVSYQFAMARLSGRPYQPSLALFAVASLYLVLHKYVLRERPGTKRWIRQDRMRKQAISHAINQITESVYHERYTPLDFSQTESYMLRAILSHVETTVEDVEGIYVNVNLLSDDPADPELLMVINRAKPERGLYTKYQKKQIHVGRAMESLDECFYEPTKHKDLWETISVDPCVSHC